MKDNKKHKILIVDDQNENILLLNGLLKSEYQTMFARDGETAIKLAQKKLPDLILLDIQMPRMDGYTVCKTLKEIEETSEIPVIFVSAMSQVGDETKGFEIGAVDYITKPISPAVVLARVKTHIQLKAARQNAIAANEAKSAFLASMSHEIRTPMNAILGMTDLSLQHNLDYDVKENLLVVRDSANHLLDIINDILDISKIEAGKVELEIIDFDLFDAIESIIRTLYVQVQNNNLYLRFDKEDNTPRYIKGDPVRLKQVLVNLIGNAIKFTQEGGVTVHVSSSKTNDDKQAFTFSVIDTGIGIPEDKLEAIFESFSQADASTTRKFGGTGLGLSISKQLVELMGGSIHVESQHGEGTRFYFHASFAPGDAQAIQKKMSTVNDQPDGKMPDKPECIHILVVDDNPSNIQVAKKFLSTFGYTAFVANSANEAFGAMSQTRMDIVLMDIEMPEMDGLEATTRIRKGEAGQMNANVPIVAMTAHALSSHQQQCIDAGMNDYITKPINFHELQLIINRVIGAKSNQYSSSVAQKKSQKEQKKLLNKKEALSRMCGDHNLYEILFNNFKSEMSSRIDKIRKNIKSKDFEQISYLSHTFKSEAGNIGADTISDICQKMESDANSKVYDQMEDLLEALCVEVEKVASE